MALNWLKNFFTNQLLSPACASFDMFDDFENRGKVFEIIQALKNPRKEGFGRFEKRSLRKINFIGMKSKS